MEIERIWRLGGLVIAALEIYRGICVPRVRLVGNGRGIALALRPGMTPDDLRARSRAFALAVIRLYSGLQRDDVVRVIGPQLLRCATGVAANYRAVGRSRSDREFASRLAVVVEEADEAEFWLDVLRTEHLGPAEQVRALNAEAGELRAIFAASRRTVLARLKRTADPKRPRTPASPEPVRGDSPPS